LYRYAQADRAEEERKQKVMARIAGRIMNRTISGAFDRWMEMTQEAKEMRILLERCASKMMNKAMSGAFDRWYEMTQESIEMKVKLRRFMLRILNKELANAFGGAVCTSCEFS
jgi:protein SFI1